MIFNKKEIKASLKNLSIYFKNNLYYNRRNSKCNYIFLIFYNNIIH